LGGRKTKAPVPSPRKEKNQFVGKRMHRPKRQEGDKKSKRSTGKSRGDRQSVFPLIVVVGYAAETGSYERKKNKGGAGEARRRTKLGPGSAEGRDGDKHKSSITGS